MTLKALMCSIFVVVATCTVFAQTTEFTYQGSLKNGAAAATGNFDFEFLLFDASTGGTQIGSTVTASAVAVANGTFSVKLDFGSNYPGANRFLEIHVRQTGGGAFTPLTPRQSVSSSPYAVKSLNADSAVNAINATNATNAATATNALQLGGVAANQYVVTTDPRMTDARTPTAGSSNYVQNGTGQQSTSNFNISGNGTAAILNATTQYNLGGQRMLSVSGPYNAGATAVTASNTFLGENAGVNTMPAVTINDPNGKFNTFTGALAGVANTTGGNNAFYGGGAGRANTTASQNSFFGADAGVSNTTGENNTFSGGFAGFRNTTQHDNTFVGFFAGSTNGMNDTTNRANFNTFVGSQSGYSNTTGYFNSFFGGNAGYTTSTGTANSFFGQAAGYNNSTGSNNNFVGYGSGSNNSSGNGNSFFGYIAGSSNTSGGANSFFGNAAGIDNSTGQNNTFIGTSAGNINASTQVNNSTAIGYGAKVSTNNTIVLGTSSETVQIPGGFSVAGNGSVAGNLGSGGNGFFAGNLGVGSPTPAVSLEIKKDSTASSNWQTGQLRISGASDPSMQLSIGYDTSSNLGSIQAGQANIGFKNLLLNPQGGRVGIGTAVPDQTFSVNGNASKAGGGSWLTFSDERLKNIKGRFTPGLAAVMRLQPLKYDYKSDNALNIVSDGEHIGFSAQAIQRVIPEAVTKNEKGFLLVNNDPIMWTMLNAIKEQQAEIETQAKQIEKENAINKKQEAEIEALKLLVCKSHRRAAVCRSRN